MFFGQIILLFGLFILTFKCIGLFHVLFGLFILTFKYIWLFHVLFDVDYNVFWAV